MFTRVRIAIRFFFFGLAVGVLLAPRSGVETRRLVREKADRLLNEVLDAASLGTAELGGAEAEPATRSRRSSGNGSRSRKSTAQTTEATESAEAESAAAT